MSAKPRGRVGSRTHPNTSNGKRSAAQYGAKDTPEAKLAFLAVIASGGSPTRAALAIGVDRRTVFDWRDRDDEFAKNWDAAKQSGIDKLEDEAFRRAHDGIDKPVTVAGEREVIKEYSDTLMTLMLKGNRPEVYRDKVEHSGTLEVQHEVTVKFVKGSRK